MRADKTGVEWTICWRSFKWHGTCTIRCQVIGPRVYCATCFISHSPVSNHNDRSMIFLWSLSLLMCLGELLFVLTSQWSMSYIFTRMLFRTISYFGSKMTTVLLFVCGVHWQLTVRCQLIPVMLRPRGQNFGLSLALEKLALASALSIWPRTC